MTIQNEPYLLNHQIHLPRCSLLLLSWNINGSTLGLFLMLFFIINPSLCNHKNMHIKLALSMFSFFLTLTCAISSPVSLAAIRIDDKCICPVPCVPQAYIACSLYIWTGVNLIFFFFGSFFIASESDETGSLLVLLSIAKRAERLVVVVAAHMYTRLAIP